MENFIGVVSACQKWRLCEWGDRDLHYCRWRRRGEVDQTSQMSRHRRSSGPLCSAFSTTPSLFNRWRRRRSSGCIALGFIRKLIFSLFHFLGLFDFLEIDVSWSETQTQVPEYPPVSAVLIHEILLVMKFGEAVCDGDAPYVCTTSR